MLRVFRIYIFFIFLISQIAGANEYLNIAGMGGAFTGLSSVEGGIFGNPAGLVSVTANNISAAFGAENLDYKGSSGNEQISADLAFRMIPSFYYSRSINRLGISLGFVYDLDNDSNMIIEDTTAVYIVDERKFESETKVILDYDVYREASSMLSVGYSINDDTSIGLRIDHRRQILKKGVITRPLHLTAVHGADVNRNDATKLIPAIINNLDISDAIERFKDGEDSQEEIIADTQGNGFDLDLGIQKRLSDTGKITVGFMLENLIQKRLANQNSSRIRIGIGAMPFRFMAAAVDIHKDIGNRGLNYNLGWKIHYEFRNVFHGGIALMNGFSREGFEDRISLGAGLILGGSQWNYAFIKRSITGSSHIVSSSTKF